VNKQHGLLRQFQSGLVRKWVWLEVWLTQQL